MRAFLAIQIIYSDHLKEVQAKLSAGKLVSDFHITILFLGDIRSADQIVSSLSGISFPSFSFSYSGIGAFPSRDPVRVIWAGVAPEEPFARLHRLVCENLRISPSADYKPHVTLARVKGDEMQRSDLEGLDIRKIHEKAASLVLFESRLTPSGPIYDVLHTFAFDNHKL